MEKNSLLMLGLVEGFVSASLGIGGGIIVIPSLMFIYHYKIKEALGLSLASIAPPVALGLIVHSFLDFSAIHIDVAGMVVLGSLIGVALGKKIEKNIHSDILYFGLPIHEAIPTSLLIILPTVLAAAFNCKPDRKSLAYIVPGAIVGSVTGALSTFYLPAEMLQFSFGIVLLVSAMKIFVQQESVDVMKRSLALFNLRF